jgi:urea transporter
MASAIVCQRCGQRQARFSVDGAPRCLTCVLRHRPMLRRSLLTALVVGTILTSINQGNVLLNGHFPMDLYWKIPLTYTVPFLVATWGALINTRLRS